MKRKEKYVYLPTISSYDDFCYSLIRQGFPEKSYYAFSRQSGKITLITAVFIVTFATTVNNVTSVATITTVTKVTIKIYVTIFTCVSTGTSVLIVINLGLYINYSIT